MTMEDTGEIIRRAQDNLTAAARDLSNYKKTFYGDRDAATVYRPAPLPVSTVLPWDAPAGMAILEVPGTEPFRHLRVPGLGVALCGEVPVNGVQTYASGLDAIDCLGCLDEYTRVSRNG